MHLEALPDYELLRGHLPMPVAVYMQTEHLQDHLAREILQYFPNSGPKVVFTSLSLQL
jgi:hypothetical protein